MTPPTAPRSNAIVLAALTAVLVLVDGAFAGIGLLVENGHRSGNLTGSEAATFLLLGASAAAGSMVLLLAVIALARRTRGHRTATIACALAWLRLAGVAIALVVIAMTLGVSAVAGMFETLGAALVLADALIGVAVTRVAQRRTRLP